MVQTELDGSGSDMHVGILHHCVPFDVGRAAFFGGGSVGGGAAQNLLHESLRGFELPIERSGRTPFAHMEHFRRATVC